MTPNSPIADLDLSRRLTLSLERLGIATVGALLAKRREEIAGMRGVGPACVAEIDKVLSEHGLALAGERHEPPPVRRTNLTITAEVYEHAARTGNVSAALEDAYRAQHGLPPRPPVEQRGRFTSKHNPRRR